MPAVVGPEPLGRAGADMFFDELVYLLGVIGNNFAAVAGTRDKDRFFDDNLMMQGADAGGEGRDYGTAAEPGKNRWCGDGRNLVAEKR